MKSSFIKIFAAVFICVSFGACAAVPNDISQSDILSEVTEDSRQESENSEEINVVDEDQTISDSADPDAINSSAEQNTDNIVNNADIETVESSCKEENIDYDALYASLIINTDPQMYTYADLEHDAGIISQLYSDYLTVDSIGTTADGRELFHFVVGNTAAEKQKFINGAIHGREYLTAQLVMKQMMMYLQNIIDDNYYGDISYRDMWNSVAVHVVPMVNPDGVTISQLGIDGLNNEETKQTVYDIAGNDGVSISQEYLDKWKANARGVDLNRNFDALWEEYYGTDYPSSDHYKGTSIGCEAESSALINLTESNNFLYTISYHTQGEIIYWNFENIDSIYDIAYSWVSQLSDSTGYSLMSDYQAVDAAGYSDWGIYRCQIPSVTIEVAYGESPYLSDQFETVLEQNREVWEITIVNAMNR